MDTQRTPADQVRDGVSPAPPPFRRGYASGKADYVARLRKIEGQVRGLQRMVEDDRWCPEVITQMGAVTGALQEVSIGLLHDHVRHCVVEAARGSAERADELLDELTATIRQVVRR